MSEKTNTTLWSNSLRIADLPNKKPTRFELVPGAAILRAITSELGLIDVKKLRFKGALQPYGQRDWELRADIGASIVQACVLTLDPVHTRIDLTVTRIYLSEMQGYEANSDVEMTEDEAHEPLPEHIDIGEVMVQTLALNLPAYPRSQGAELQQSDFTAPGIAPMSDQDARPFAGLKSLRDSLQTKDD